MRKKSIALFLALAFVFVGLTGCGGIISFQDPKEKRREAISDYLSKDVIGKTGETYKTKWFEFTIHSIEKVDSYVGRKAEEGHQLYKALITQKNIWDDSIPLGIFDFYMDDPGFAEYIWAIPPLDNTMMPEEFTLEINEFVQHVMIFEVPVGTTKLALMYTENYEGGNGGATFSISID